MPTSTQNPTVLSNSSNRRRYLTPPEMDKLIAAGYSRPFHSLEEGIQDYVANYLSKDIYYWENDPADTWS